jgi:hypothetical protein
MDEFKEEVEGAISSATDVDDLLARYRPAFQAVQAVEKKNQGKPPEEWRFTEEEPFKSEATLRQAIEEWEEKQRQLFQMRVYWTFGFATALLGLVVHKNMSHWLGLAWLITGFSEMIWWCSPPWIYRVTTESDRLLSNKLILSVLTTVLIVAAARFLGLLKNSPLGNSQNIT